MADRRRTITTDATTYRALATAGAALVTFIGVCHEVVGEALFPWGPSFVGGPLPWHGLGLFVIAVGVNLVTGALGWNRFPVVPFALVVAATGAFFTIVAALLHGQFHLFASTACVAGVLTAYAHREAGRSDRG